MHKKVTVRRHFRIWKFDDYVYTKDIYIIYKLNLQESWYGPLFWLSFRYNSSSRIKFSCAEDFPGKKSCKCFGSTKWRWYLFPGIWLLLISLGKFFSIGILGPPGMLQGRPEQDRDFFLWDMFMTPVDDGGSWGGLDFSDFCDGVTHPAWNVWKVVSCLRISRA